MIKKNKILRYCSWLLLLLFLSYQYFVCNYTHSHKVGDTIIVHTHPFAKTTKTQHAHTLYEIACIDLLVFHFAILALILILRIARNRSIRIRLSRKVSFIKSLFYIHHYRGPPIARF